MVKAVDIITCTSSDDADQYVAKHYSGDKVLVRCLSSKEHAKYSLEELVQLIAQTGTDRYDPHRKMMFHEFYEAHAPDLFADLVEVSEESPIIGPLFQDFFEKTKGDRQEGVRADIVLLYDPDKLEMISNVYENQEQSDCFRFKHIDRKVQALLAIICISDNT